MGESPLIPAEVLEQLRRFHENLTSTEDAMEAFIAQKPEDRLQVFHLLYNLCFVFSFFFFFFFFFLFLVTVLCLFLKTLIFCQTA